MRYANDAEFDAESNGDNRVVIAPPEHELWSIQVKMCSFDRSRPPEAADFATAGVWESRFDAEFDAESNGENRISIASPGYEL